MTGPACVGPATAAKARTAKTKAFKGLIELEEDASLKRTPTGKEDCNPYEQYDLH